MAKYLSALFAVAILAACAPNTVDAPSLLPRANEKANFDEPEAVPVVVAPDPALDAAIEEARQTLATTAAAFALNATKAENLIGAARDAAAGSGPWLDAQVALAGLDDQRATSLALLSDLDDRAIDRGASGAPPYPALETLRAEAQAQVTKETARIASLSARLPSH